MDSRVPVRVTFIAYNAPDGTKKLFLNGNCEEILQNGELSKLNVNLSFNKEQAKQRKEKEIAQGRATVELAMKKHQDGQLTVSDTSECLQIWIEVTPKKIKSESVGFHRVSLCSKNETPNQSVDHFNVHVHFNGSVIVEPNVGYYLLPANSTKNYFDSLAKAVGMGNKSVEKIIKQLVPVVTIEGKYDKRHSFPKPLNDIYGNDELNTNESAIQQTCVKSRTDILEYLTAEYHRRFEEVFKLFVKHEDFPYQITKKSKKENKEKDGNALLARKDGNELKENEFFDILMNLAEQINIKNKKQATFFCTHAHAIIRGRMEAFLVVLNFNLMSDDSDSQWQSHMLAAGAWFVFLVRIFKNSKKFVKSDDNFLTSPNADPPPVSEDKIHLTAKVSDKLEELKSFRLHHTNLLPRETVLQYLYQRVNFVRRFDLVKDIYAQRLVPKLNLDGSYNKGLKANEKIIFSKLYAEGFSFIPTDSAVRMIQEAAIARQDIQQLLRSKFEERQEEIEGNLSPDKKFIKLFLIVRARLEYVTTMEINLLGKDGFSLWRKELRVAGDYFQQMMNQWRLMRPDLIKTPRSKKKLRDSFEWHIQQLLPQEKK